MTHTITPTWLAGAFGRFRFDTPDENGNGGAQTPPADPPEKDDKPKDKSGDNPGEEKPVALTQADLDKARAEAKAEALAEAKAKREEEEAKQRGEFEKLYTKAEQEKAALAQQVRNLKVRDALNGHLARELPAYAAVADDILPHIERHLSDGDNDDAIAAIVKREAKAFAERNPRQTKGGGAPEPTRESGRLPDAPHNPRITAPRRRPFAHTRFHI